MDEKNKKILITGGAKGLGRGMALSFAKAGASIVIGDTDGDAGKSVEEEINNSNGKVLFIKTDVSSTEDVNELFKKGIAFLGGLDVLINNAGIAHGPNAEQHFLKTDQNMWDNIMKVNLRGLYLCSQKAARYMISEKIEGSIINVSSGGATQAHRNRVAYDATKGAIEAATRAMSLDLSPWKIRVNAVMPGAIEVESRSSIGEESTPENLIPLGRHGTPEDVAQAALFLSSSNASYITGHVLAVDGGLTSQLRPPAMDVDVNLPFDKM